MGRTAHSSGGRRLFSFGACFGLSSPRKQQMNILYHGPAPSAAAVESEQYASNKNNYSRSDIPTSESIKEIQTAAAAEPHQANNKTRVDEDMTAWENKKEKREQSNIPEEISSNWPTIKLRHSVSLQARPDPPQPWMKKGKTAAAATGKGGDGDEMSAMDTGKVDSMVGASMIALTLVVMLIWGKVCAILCSAAWVLFIHCFRQSNESLEHKNVLNNHRIILDLDSHEYKKRVVLQGFLQRI